VDRRRVRIAHAALGERARMGEVLLAFRAEIRGLAAPPGEEAIDLQLLCEPDGVGGADAGGGP
jgi:hypothetical protein